MLISEQTRQILIKCLQNFVTKQTPYSLDDIIRVNELTQELDKAALELNAAFDVENTVIRNKLYLQLVWK